MKPIRMINQQTMKLFSIPLCLIAYIFLSQIPQTGTLKGQTLSKNVQTDSTLVKGRFVWKNPSIEGYPSQVKITSSSHPKIELSKDVDSLGGFEASLVPGKYTVSPGLNYHWMGEELIRIDAKKSAQVIEVKRETSPVLTIHLDTIPWPTNPHATGILQRKKEIDYQEIDAFMRERLAFFEIPGASLSLIKDNKIFYTQTYGLRKVNTQLAVTSQTLFEAGSITKLVFAFAVMRLYEKGMIDLDKPIYEYLPIDNISDDRYTLITARHILSHQSGLANWPRKDKDGKYPMKFTPGTQYGYSGRAYEYLKSVLEKITSQSIEQILQEEVLDPLGLHDMHFKGNEEIKQHGANGHKKYIPSDILLAKQTMVAFTLQTTSEALAQFALAFHQRKGLKKETYAEMLKVHSQRADGTRWGLGVRIEENAAGISYGHSGSTGRGFISNLVIYEDSGLGYVVLTNSQMGGWLALPLLNEYLILGKEN